MNTDVNCVELLCPEKGAAEQVVISGILPILALSLRHRGPLTLLTAKLVAELAKECKLIIHICWSVIYMYTYIYIYYIYEISHVV